MRDFLLHTTGNEGFKRGFHVYKTENEGFCLYGAGIEGFYLYETGIGGFS